MGIDVKILEASEPLNFNDLLNAVLRVDERCGAIVLFVGVVKGIVEGDKRVSGLEYSAIKSTAIKVMERIASEEARKYNLSHVTIWHRVGALRSGEVTIVIAVSAENRKDAFRAAEEILERVKSEAPIFKLEKRSDGEFWIIGDGVRIKRTTLE
jgi:molybdopterin synthase catalytic subunit